MSPVSEDEPAKAAALKISAALNANVVVTAGIHWDGLGPEGIRAVVRNTEILVGMIIRKLSSASPSAE
jgi:predicted metal-dependent phosphotriesterase family hydrolase